MTVICLEGPSAAGKTTLAAAISSNDGAAVVPEVNQLFDRSGDEPWHWYFDRQVDRWRKARQAADDGGLAILDGDIFQPLWYGWTYGYSEGASLSEMLDFYLPLLDQGVVNAPDQYFVLECSESELRRRSAGDGTRTRRNFNRHLSLVRSQRAYFDELSRLVPGLVCWLPMSDVESSVHAVSSELARLPQPSRPSFGSVLGRLENLLGTKCEG